MNLSLRGILSNEYIFLNNASGVAKIKIRLLYKNRILVEIICYFWVVNCFDVQIISFTVS